MNDGMRGLLLHSTRRSLSLNSHCMMLWINVASFCVSLLTREGERLRGIFSDTVSVEEYCVSQLRLLWKLMRSNMQLTDEELSYLVMMCMRRKLQVCILLLVDFFVNVLMICACFSSVHAPQIWMSSPESMCGTITELEKIIEYEKQWHADIYVPCLKKLGTEVCVHACR